MIVSGFQPRLPAWQPSALYIAICPSSWKGNIEKKIIMIHELKLISFEFSMIMKNEERMNSRREEMMKQEEIEVDEGMKEKERR